MAFHFGPGPDAYLAFDQGFAVVLDLANNRYWALDADALSRPEPTPAIKALLHCGSLRALAPPQAHIGQAIRSAARITHTPPRKAPALDAAAWGRFLIACLWARWVVSTGRLDAARRTLVRLRSGQASTQDAGEAVARFEQMRPLWPGDQVCLFDSLTLARFLLSEGRDAKIVFGVRTRPFSAHCWVESEQEVLLDLTGQFASYVVICRL